MENRLEIVKTPELDLDAELATLIGYFEDYERETIENRAEAERDRDYYDGKQWTQAEVDKLNGRGQPAITLNRIKPKIDFLLGLEKQTRTDPKAYPRTPKHEKESESATDALRYVCDNNDFDYVRSDVAEQIYIEGVGAGEVYVEDVNGKLEIGIKHIPWDRIYYDIHSRNKGFTDCRYRGITVWMDSEEALNQHPGSEDVIEAAYNSGELGYTDTFDDAPRTNWAIKDSDRKRLRINQVYYLKGDIWYYAYHTYGGFLKGKEPKPCPYLDEHKQPECPLEFQSAFVDRDGRRYGIVRQMVDIQDEINKRRSKALHLMSVRQTFGRDDAIPDINELKSQLAKPDGHIKTTYGEFGKDFGVLPTGDMATAQFSLLQESKEEIDAIGANSSMTGKDDRSMSGRALQSRTQSGVMELGPVMDAKKAWQKRIYRQVWNRIRQYWKEERWVRVTDSDEKPRWVGINQPVRLGDKLAERFGELPPEYAQDPRLQQIVEVKNQVAELDVDIIIDETPDMITLQHEQFELLAQMFQANPQGIPFDMIIEASQLRNKEKLLKRMRGEDEQSPQQQQQQQQEAERMRAMAEEDFVLTQEKKRVDINAQIAKTANTMADTRKTQNETALSTIQGGR